MNVFRILKLIPIISEQHSFELRLIHVLDIFSWPLSLLREMTLERRLKDAMLLEGEILKTKVLASLFNKEKEAMALKKEVLEKASKIEELEKENEKRKTQVQRMRYLVQPLRDTIVAQAKQSQLEVGEMQAKVKALEVKINESEEKADLLTTRLEEKRRECLELGDAKKSLAQVEELLAKVKSGSEIVKKNNRQIEKELEKKRLLTRGKGKASEIYI